MRYINVQYLLTFFYFYLCGWIFTEFSRVYLVDVIHCDKFCGSMLKDFDFIGVKFPIFPLGK